MELHLQRVGDWQGTAMIPASDLFAVFAYMVPQGDSPDIWTELLIAWIMAERCVAKDEVGTVFYGMSLVPTDADRLHRGAGACEEFHDERGCHLGYTKQGLGESGGHAWLEAAREHMRTCQRRKAALGLA